MGHFHFSLPNKVKGEVRWGKVIRAEKGFLNLFLPWKSFSREEKRGYIIRLESATDDGREFRFFKSAEGNWSRDAEGLVKIEGEIPEAIRKAIEYHENAVS